MLVGKVCSASAAALVADVATAYLTLRELDNTLEISQRTLENRRASLDLTKSRQLGGVGTLLVIAAWSWLFPELRQAGSLHSMTTSAQQVVVESETAAGKPSA